MRALVAAGLLLVPGCVVRHTIDVQIASRTGGSLPAGFSCRDASGHLLAERAIDPGRGNAFSLVVDLIDMRGVPAGVQSTTQLQNYCSSLAADSTLCSPIARYRTCTPEALTVVDLPDGGRMPALTTPLEGQPILDDAPSGYVIVRAVATTEPCSPGPATMVPAFDPTAVIGCAFSEPVLLALDTQSIVLDLPSLTSACAAEALACAAGLRRGP